MSIVINTTSGLPGGYPYEFDLRRLGIDGRVIGEFTKLAVEDTPSSGTIPMELMAMMICWSMDSGIDDIVCVVHPRHARTWAHIFGWRSLGGIKGHAGVNGNPGILLHLDLKRLPNSFEGLPMRGQRALRQARACRLDQRHIFRPSGSEAAAVMAQCPRLLTSSPPEHRVGISRYYPWASRLVQDVLSVSSLQSVLLTASVSARPHRDRSIVFPNQASRLRMDSGDRYIRMVEWDQLLFPDAPMALFLDDGGSTCGRLAEALDDLGFIVIRCNEPTLAVDVLRGQLFDLVLTTLPNSHPDLQATSAFIRARDAVVDLHTPIISIPEIFDGSDTDILFTERCFFTQVASLQALARVLTLITTVFENDPNATTQSTHSELRPKLAHG